MRLPYLGLGLDHAAGSMTVPEEYVQTKSPFAKMKPLRAPLTGKEIHVQTLTGRLQQQVGHPEFSVLTLLIFRRFSGCQNQSDPSRRCL